MECSLPGSSVHGILQPRLLERVAIPFLGDLPDPGIKPRSPKLQADSLLAEPQGKLKNTGVGGLGLIARLGRSPRKGKGYSLQYPGLVNSMDCIVHGVAKSRT